jgi:hypothetical protein
LVRTHNGFIHSLIIVNDSSGNGIVAHDNASHVDDNDNNTETNAVLGIDGGPTIYTIRHLFTSPDSSRYFYVVGHSHGIGIVELTANQRKSPVLKKGE